MSTPARSSRASLETVARSGLGPLGAELLSQAERVRDGPAFGDLAVRDSIHLDPLDGHRPAGGLDAHDLAAMGPGEGPAVRHLVAHADHVLVLEMDIGERRAVELHKAAYPVGAGRHLGGGGIMVAVVRMDKHLNRLDPALVEDLREEPPDERFWVHGGRFVSGAASADPSRPPPTGSPRPAIGAAPPPVRLRAARAPRAHRGPPPPAAPGRDASRARGARAGVPRCSSG